jgi:hypothetical protein
MSEIVENGRKWVSELGNGCEGSKMSGDGHGVSLSS